MCLHKMEQRLGSGQLFDGAVISEFCVMQKEQEVAKASLLEKVHPEVKDVAEEEVLYRDVLVGATQATRQLFDVCMELREKFRRSTTYKILTRTTQPSHAISMLFVSFILLVLWPNLVGQSPVTSGTSGAGVEAVADLSACPVTQSRANVLVALAYFGSFATHFGAQMWMTFVSGLALYFNLPRHTFGRVQEILFPKYFSMGTGLSVVTLLTFIKLQQTAHPELQAANLSSWDPLVVLQLVSLALCAALELIVWLYLAPPMLRLMHQKYHFEASETVGQEVGHFSGAENAQLRRSNHYQNVHKRFRKIHMATAMVNMVSLLCTFVHLHYLASRVQLL
ncbi:AAEL007758-PA [Aedes aegypti]|uniref:AAEL007758-PA n=2 Tax=Aedes aegypti TaxID=7159 RepID=A0A1S4FHF5_AEDAE|nr:transmembrane protein 205 [Aedes aegypti]EAT40520.1 AAEL007758-PA [Aedes aegypti]